MKWERIAPKCREHAHKLRHALASALELLRGGKWDRADVAAAGLRDYQRVFGHSISEKHFWRILDRVVDRDAGRADFMNLEIYLPGAVMARSKVPEFEKAAREVPDLAVAILAVHNPSAPTEVESSLIWDAACNEWLRLCQAGGTNARAKKKVLQALASSGVELAIGYAALRQSFSRKLARWIDGGYNVRAIRDQRRFSKKQTFEISETDKNLIIARAQEAGSFPAGWRELRKSGELSAELDNRFIQNPASKSYVPKKVRELLSRKMAERIDDRYHGARRFKQKGAFISRDHSKDRPGDWYQADDTTLPVRYWQECPAGEPQILRGQFLVMIDCRSLRVLGFLLHSENNYNATVVRGLILRTHDAYGLPRHGFYFENGIWKSKLIVGSKLGKDDIPGEETELGLREFGLEFKNTIPANPQAKVVERVIGLLQVRMEGQPGYCGRLEQVEKYERLDQLCREAERGKRHPREFLLHRDEWGKRLQDICDAYNNEPQQGKMCNGLSPREVWENRFDYNRPLVRLTDETRYLLASHRKPITIGRNGLSFWHQRLPYTFRNEVTGRLIGRRVQMYFNPEDMSSVFIKVKSTDTTASVIPAAPSVPAMTATREEMRAASASVAAHNNGALTLYATVKPYFSDNGPTFRRVVADEASVTLGREIAEDQAAIRSRQAANDSIERQLASYRRRYGAMPTQDTVAPEQQLEAYKLLESGDE